MGSSWLRTDFSGYTFLGAMFRLERAGQRIDIRIIQGYLGHRSISSTVRYTRLDGQTVRETILKKIMNEADDEKEVIYIGDPETKPKRALPFRISSNGKTGRQKKAHARTLAMIADPKNIDDEPPHIDTRSNKGRAIRRKRAAARRKAEEKFNNTRKKELHYRTGPL
jgi:hypothetical protein